MRNKYFTLIYFREKGKASGVRRAVKYKCVSGRRSQGGKGTRSSNRSGCAHSQDREMQVK